MDSRAAKILQLVKKCNSHADHDNEDPENQTENHGK